MSTPINPSSRLSEETLNSQSEGTNNAIIVIDGKKYTVEVQHPGKSPKTVQKTDKLAHRYFQALANDLSKKEKLTQMADRSISISTAIVGADDSNTLDDVTLNDLLRATPEGNSALTKLENDINAFKQARQAGDDDDSSISSGSKESTPDTSKEKAETLLKHFPKIERQEDMSRQASNLIEGKSAAKLLSEYKPQLFEPLKEFTIQALFDTAIKNVNQPSSTTPPATPEQPLSVVRLVPLSPTTPTPTPPVSPGSGTVRGSPVSSHQSGGSSTSHTANSRQPNPRRPPSSSPTERPPSHVGTETSSTPPTSPEGSRTPSPARSSSPLDGDGLPSITPSSVRSDAPDGTRTPAGSDTSQGIGIGRSALPPANPDQSDRRSFRRDSSDGTRRPESAPSTPRSGKSDEMLSRSPSPAGSDDAAAVPGSPRAAEAPAPAAAEACWADATDNQKAIIIATQLNFNCAVAASSDFPGDLTEEGNLKATHPLPVFKYIMGNEDLKTAFKEWVDSASKEDIDTLIEKLKPFYTNVSKDTLKGLLDSEWRDDERKLSEILNSTE